MRTFKVIDKYGNAELLAETLSDGSLAFSVRVPYHGTPVIFDCTSQQAANDLALAFQLSGAV